MEVIKNKYIGVINADISQLAPNFQKITDYVKI